MPRILSSCLFALTVATFGACGFYSGDTAPDSTPSGDALQNGDIIFQTSLSRQSEPIQLATNSPYSHVGIVYVNDGKTYVFEAVQPVKLTPLDAWIDRGKDDHYVVKRLKDTAGLTPDNLKAMRAVGEAWLGTSYDVKFQWSDDLLYCSELVWKVFDRGAGIQLCDPSGVDDLELTNPKVEALLIQRYGSRENVPDDEVIVTPADLFECDLLTTVVEH